MQEYEICHINFTNNIPLFIPKSSLSGNNVKFITTDSFIPIMFTMMWNVIKEQMGTFLNAAICIENVFIKGTDACDRTYTFNISINNVTYYITIDNGINVTASQSDEPKHLGSAISEMKIKNYMYTYINTSNINKDQLYERINNEHAVLNTFFTKINIDINNKIKYILSSHILIIVKAYDTTESKYLSYPIIIPTSLANNKFDGSLREFGRVNTMFWEFIESALGININTITNIYTNPNFDTEEQLICTKYDFIFNITTKNNEKLSIVFDKSDINKNGIHPSHYVNQEEQFVDLDKFYNPSKQIIENITTMMEYLRNRQPGEILSPQSMQEDKFNDLIKSISDTYNTIQQQLQQPQIKQNTLTKLQYIMNECSIYTAKDVHKHTTAKKGNDQPDDITRITCTNAIPSLPIFAPKHLDLQINLLSYQQQIQLCSMFWKLLGERIKIKDIGVMHRGCEHNYIFNLSINDAPFHIKYSNMTFKPQFKYKGKIFKDQNGMSYVSYGPFTLQAQQDYYNFGINFIKVIQQKKIEYEYESNIQLRQPQNDILTGNKIEQIIYNTYIKPIIYELIYVNQSQQESQQESQQKSQQESQPQQPHTPETLYEQYNTQNFEKQSELNKLKTVLKNHKYYNTGDKKGCNDGIPTIVDINLLQELIKLQRSQKWKTIDTQRTQYSKLFWKFIHDKIGTTTLQNIYTTPKNNQKMCKYIIIVKINETDYPITFKDKHLDIVHDIDLSQWEIIKCDKQKYINEFMYTPEHETEEKKQYINDDKLDDTINNTISQIQPILSPQNSFDINLQLIMNNFKLYSTPCDFMFPIITPITIPNEILNTLTTDKKKQLCNKTWNAIFNLIQQIQQIQQTTITNLLVSKEMDKCTFKYLFIITTYNNKQFQILFNPDTNGIIAPYPSSSTNPTEWTQCDTISYNKLYAIGKQMRLYPQEPQDDKLDGICAEYAKFFIDIDKPLPVQNIDGIHNIMKNFHININFHYDQPQHKTPTCEEPMLIPNTQLQHNLGQLRSKKICKLSWHYIKQAFDQLSIVSLHHTTPCNQKYVLKLEFKLFGDNSIYFCNVLYISDDNTCLVFTDDKAMRETIDITSMTQVDQLNVEQYNNRFVNMKYVQRQQQQQPRSQPQQQPRQQRPQHKSRPQQQPRQQQKPQ